MFEFPKVEHKEFKKNFLKTVIFQLKYDKYELIKDKSDEIERIFKSDFPRFSTAKGHGFEISIGGDKKASFQQLEKGYLLDMKSADGQKTININEDTLSLTITGKAYKNFEDISSQIDNIINFFKLCNISKVNKIAIRKINIIEFKYKDNPCEILNLLLNNNLIGNVNFFPKQNNINHYIQSLNYKEDNNLLNIKYGLSIPQQTQKDDNIGQVIIDIDLFKQEELTTDKISFTSKEINMEIYNIFNWVISSNTLNLLDE